MLKISVKKNIQTTGSTRIRIPKLIYQIMPCTHSITIETWRHWFTRWTRIIALYWRTSIRNQAILNVFSLPYKEYGKLCPPIIIEHTWGFIGPLYITIKSSHKLPKPLHINDKSINKPIASDKYDTVKLIQVNACRNYLQVLSSAICEGDGHRILEHCLEGRRNETRTNKWNWSYLPCPPTRYWKTWQKTLDEMFLINVTKYLKEKVGNWISEPHQDWKWFLDNEKENMYNKEGVKYYWHLVVGQNLRHNKNHPFKGIKSMKPKILHRTTV